MFFFIKVDKTFRSCRGASFIQWENGEAFTFKELNCHSQMVTNQPILEANGQRLSSDEAQATERRDHQLEMNGLELTFRNDIECITAIVWPKHISHGLCKTIED